MFFGTYKLKVIIINIFGENLLIVDVVYSVFAVDSDSI